jgi:RNA polymerase sigma-70 factor (ECF subfamily)
MELEATVAELAPRVLRFCLGRTAAPEVAEEVAQDALAALVGRWRRHGPPESPEAFVFAVARRRAFRAGLRRRLLLPLASLGDGHGPPNGGDAERALVAARPPGVEERAAIRSELSRALAALGRLPARDREALLLVAAGGLATVEAARVLGVSPGALKMRVHRARKRLTELLEVSDDGSS